MIALIAAIASKPKSVKFTSRITAIIFITPPINTDIEFNFNRFAVVNTLFRTCVPASGIY
jgi:hypothetical protein